MLTKKEIAYIKKLQTSSRFRKAEKKFVAETPKVISSLLHSNVKIERIYATETWKESFLHNSKIPVKVVSEKDLKRISSLTTPNQVLAIAQIPEVPLPKQLPDNWYIYLDSVRDPGNMGTIIRLCHWFNIPYLFGSPDCVDVYNPKVVQASMGSIGFVKFFPLPILELHKTYPDFSIFCTSTRGNPINALKLPAKGIIIAGNESHGISREALRICHSLISIPRFSDNIDSLNVAVATAITLSYIKLCRSQ